MVYDLRTFLKDYGQVHPEEICYVEEPVDRAYQVTAIVAKLEKAKKFPILIFNQVLIDGHRSAFPVITALLASRLRLARLLGCSVTKVGQACYERMQKPQKPLLTGKEEAPVKEVVLKGEEVDLTRFPALVHHHMDPGPYITAGFFTCYDPETGRENSTLHRGWVKGPKEVRLLLGPATHNYVIWQKYEKAGQDMPAAYWMGHHPLVVLGCQAKVPPRASHYETAGGMAGCPLRLVPSESLGEQFLVPADAEIVIEGIVPAGQRRPEGPFGEYTRYVGPQHWGPFMQIRAVTFRRDAFWDSVMVGHSHWVMGSLVEGVAYQNILRVAPSLQNVYVPMSGCGAFHLYLQVKVTGEGLSRAALVAGLNSSPQVKHAFVFDEDVDIFDEREVLWALATRFQGDRDLVILKDVIGPDLDPSGLGNIGTKVGFDCTKPAPPRPFSRRLKVPAHVMEGIELDKFISQKVFNNIPEEPYG